MTQSNKLSPEQSISIQLIPLYCGYDFGIDRPKYKSACSQNLCYFSMADSNCSNLVMDGKKRTCNFGLEKKLE